MLHQQHGWKVAVIVNEFGEVGVDDALVLSAGSEEIMEMNTGCICCTVRGDLIKILQRLLSRATRLDAILIETTGLADPAPVAPTFFVDDSLTAEFRPDAIVAVVDAKHALLHLQEHKPDGVENEVHIVDEAAKKAVLKILKGINAAVEGIETVQCSVDISKIINIRAFDLDRILSMEPQFLQDDGEHQHAASVTSVGIALEGSLHIPRINDWLSALLTEKGADIFRSKGVLAVAGSNDKYEEIPYSGAAVPPWKVI